MNKPMTDFERMVDQVGRPLTWDGQWRLLDRSGYDELPPILPAVFPREYYKERPSTG